MHRLPRNILLILSIFLSIVNISLANEQIRIVGSSTLYPFVTVIAEKFGKYTKKATPIIESTGTGGGINLFCTLSGTSRPSILMASRKMRPKERDLCYKHDVKEIIEIIIGYDGIIIASSNNSDTYKLTTTQLFLALAKEIPSQGKLISNPYYFWSDIDQSLPNKPIEVYGPSLSSGTRADFEEIIMARSCDLFKEYNEYYPNKDYRLKACSSIRRDGRFIEMGENDNLVIQKIASNQNALGIFGYNFLEQNYDIIKPALINGIKPNFDNIASKKYPLSRPLFIYINKEAMITSETIRSFSNYLISPTVIGKNGYLLRRGLITLNDNELKDLNLLLEGNF
jgi:phosphate transport system substrate-binding protein